MADKSPIEWTDATWNPIVGCDIVSPGCTNCYAMGMAARIEAMSAGLGRPTHYEGTTRRVKGKAVWTGRLALAPEKIRTEPLRWKRPRMVFVNSMGDLFHEHVPDEWIDQVFAIMALCPQHTFQVLTKRSARMREYVSGLPERRAMLACNSGLDWVEWPLSNVWLGVSAERQEEADERVPDLLATPAAIRFVSAEPLLGPIDFERTWMNHVNDRAPFDSARLPGLDWIIVGGESGPHARPMHPDWARSIRDQCAAAGIPFFFKQWGEWGMPPCSLDELDWGMRQFAELAERAHWFDDRACVRPAEPGWIDKYKLDLPGKPFPPDFDASQTPEYRDQVRRCPQASCRSSGRCQGNQSRAAVVWLGKHSAGRLLDGVEHNGMPEIREVPAL